MKSSNVDFFVFCFYFSFFNFFLLYDETFDVEIMCFALSRSMRLAGRSKLLTSPPPSPVFFVVVFFFSFTVRILLYVTESLALSKPTSRQQQIDQHSNSVTCVGFERQRSFSDDSKTAFIFFSHRPFKDNVHFRTVLEKAALIFASTLKDSVHFSHPPCKTACIFASTLKGSVHFSHQPWNTAFSFASTLKDSLHYRIDSGR